MTSNRTRPAAEIADPHDLYQRSVQDAGDAVAMLETFFESRADRAPLLMREDFCGTALISAGWVRSDPRRRALGVDLDAATLRWGEEHNRAPLGEDAGRLTLRCQDVRDPVPEKADLTCAFNFSFNVFRTREDLLGYFRSARQALVDEGGLFVLDLMGGPDAQFKLEEETELEEFTYVWEQEMFDPVNNRLVCHIHFRFPDGSSIENAFTYDWRIWTIPELKELLLEAGFDLVDVWWEGGDDLLRVVDSAENNEAWIAYLAAWT